MNMIIKFNIWELLQKENISVELMTSKFQKINQTVNALVKYQNDRETAANILNSLICSDAIKKLILQAVIERVELGSAVHNLAISNLGLSFNKSKAVKVSYVWQNNPDIELPELYTLMVNECKLIASETTFEQFKAVFTGQPIDENFEPVRWHQENASELLYFIDRLEQSNNIEHNPKRADYQKLTACFIKPDGSRFNEVLKTLKQQIELIAPDKKKVIDELVGNF
jgi:hypothetical protein